MNNETLELVGLLSQEYSSNLGWASFVVAALSVLVALLIGTQIANYWIFRKIMRSIVNNALQDYQKKAIPIFNGLIKLANSKAYFLSLFPQAIDDNMEALEEILKSPKGELKQFAINLVMENLNNIKEAIANSKEPFTFEDEIYKGKRDKYLTLLKKVDSDYKALIAQWIKNATEIEMPADKESLTRVFAEKKE